MRTKLDKIFDNKFEEQEFDGSNISFNIDPAYGQSGDPEMEIHFDMIFDEIHNIVINSELKVFNEIDEKTGVAKKLNKVHINQVYGYVINNMETQYRKIDLFSVLSEYFDILPTKFYNSLSNSFKDELMMELDKSTNILSRKKITKLF